MKKVIVSIFAVIGVIAVILAILGIYVIHDMSAHDEQPNTGVIQKDGGEVFYISQEMSETGKGGTYFLFLENDGVMLGDSQDDTTVPYGTFIPQKSGRCIIYAVDYFCTDEFNERLYDVTVDENLKISYVQRDAYKFFPLERISFENCQMTVQKDGNSTAVQKQTAVEIGNEMSAIYGSETASYITAPDLSEGVKIICVHSLEDHSRTVEFYMLDNKLYYCNIIAGNEEWHEFTLEDFCSLDGINELLDLKD
ncbi:MAG: hypothetical protein K2J73_08715 [Oscillospiraceae bacterium]|nr:hypothetical protein [Oscillospiraceae bacterium]